MRMSTLKTAIMSAEEFLFRAKRLEISKPKQEIEWGYSKDTAAVRRSSMELTRVLADLRQNR